MGVGNHQTRIPPGLHELPRSPSDVMRCSCFLDLAELQDAHLTLTFQSSSGLSEFDLEFWPGRLTSGETKTLLGGWGEKESATWNSDSGLRIFEKSPIGCLRNDDIL